MKRGLVLLFGLIVYTGTSAQQPVEINDLINEREFMPYELMIFIDTANRYTFSEISSPQFADRFVRHSSYQNKDSYLAIDQGPIIVMVENYRTALLWDLFMSAPEIKNGLTKSSLTY